MEYQSCRQWGKASQGPDEESVILNLENLHLMENLLPVSDQCIRHMTVVCCLCEGQLMDNLCQSPMSRLKILPERNFMSTGAMGSGQRRT